MKTLSRTLIIGLFLLSHHVCDAQQRFRLNDNWEFLKQDLGSIWEAVRPVGEGKPESVPRWEKVSLPHCVNATDAVDPYLNYYQGPTWYRTRLEIANPYTNGRTLLHFEGAGQKTEVYVYQTKVGSHVGGYDEWTVDITEAVEAFRKSDTYKKQPGKGIPVSIRTDNSRDLEMIPSDLSDFNLYGGIYRYLNLVYVPALSIDKIFATPTVDPTGKTATMKIKASFLNPLALKETKILVRLLDPSGKETAEFEGKIEVSALEVEVADFSVKNPELWSPDDPSLYQLEVILEAAGTETCKQTEKIGFRHFEFQPKGPFLLNGKRLLLQGTHRHEDHAGVGAAMTEAMIRREMIMMKEMGVNFIRLGHYQQSRIVLELCDSLGMLVWEEIPWCRGGLGGDTYKEQAKRMLANMIEQHYNHPAVIIWGLGNENDWPGDFEEFNKEKIRAFMSELNDIAHQVDPFRKTAIRRCDFCKDIVDVYSPSIWAGWYRGKYTDYKAVSENEYRTVNHFLHVEWGADSHAGRHSEEPEVMLGNVASGTKADERSGDASLHGGDVRMSRDGDWSESYVCNLVDWHLKEQETMPWLTGTAYWPFKDFSTPVRPENPVPYVNQKGVVQRDFTPKEVYYVFQSYWAEKPMAHIYGHTWPVRWGEAGEEKTVKVYSNCDEAELFLNGRSLGRKQRNSQDFPAAGLHWSAVFRPGENHVKVTARKGKSVVEDEITFFYQTDKWGAPARMALEKVSEVNGEAAVQVKLFDKNGVHCPDAANWVEFSLVGDGRLLDNLGTSTGSRKVQCYNGRASIRVQTRGINFISVKSEGMPTVFLKLNGTANESE